MPHLWWPHLKSNEAFRCRARRHEVMQPGLSSNDECHGSGGGEAGPNAVVAPVFNLI